MERKHFSHDHPLQEVECTAELCAGCRSDINGLAFGCKRCTFYLHKFCFKLPPELRNVLRAEHQFKLKLHPFRAGDQYFRCEHCYHRIYEQGFVYVSYTYDEYSKYIEGMLHVDCALLEHPYHRHSIVCINERELFSTKCAACGTKFHENEHKGFNLYGCHDCGDAFHNECLDLPAQVKGKVMHPHDLSRYLGPVLQGYNEWDYYFCDGCKEKRADPTKERLRHFSHRHPLVELELEHTSKLCVGCWTTINGPSFSCERCQFSLHKHCAELPRELYHPSHPCGSLKLKLRDWDSIDRYGAKCEICDRLIHKPSFVYECNGRCSSECIGLTIHFKCALLEPSLNSSYHKHPLVFIKEKGRANCVACRTEFEFEYGGTSFYLCQECGDEFHKECLDMPFQIKCDRHPHDLTFHMDPIPEDYDDEVKYFCDNCNEERDIHAFSYVCKECDYFCHIRCDIYNQEIKDEEEERECEILMERGKEELDKIKEKIKSLKEELHTTLSEESLCEAALKDLQEKRDRIREKRGRN